MRWASHKPLPQDELLITLVCIVTLGHMNDYTTAGERGGE